MHDMYYEYRIIYKMKKYTSAVRSTKNNFFDQNSALQAACDNSIARVTECVPSCRIQVGDSPANARVNRTKTPSLVLRTETV